MSGEYQSHPTLFDLDRLDQDSIDAAREAQYEELERIRALPDHAQVIAQNAALIQELDTSDAPIEDKAVVFLRMLAIETASKLELQPGAVPVESVEFAARFFVAPETSRDAVLAAFDRYHNYALALSWAVTYNRTIAQAREDIAETRPHFQVDYGLTERKPDPFRSLDSIEWLDDES